MTRAARHGKFLAAVAAALVASPAVAQLRIVTLNGFNADSTNSDYPNPRSPWIDTVLAAIGSSVSDDPYIAGNTGIVKPIDILALQEVESAETTVKGYCNIMNSLYPSANYQYGKVNGASTGAGTQGIVYNANAVTLVATKLIGTSSGSGQPRQALRYQLRPTGYSSSADIYLYNSHYKAGDGATDPTLPQRRLVEATAIRADSDALGPNKNIIYAGDFNVYHDTEPMFQKLIEPGNGQALDPINKIGDWHNNPAYLACHTQSPFNATTAANLGTGFSGATGGMDDRFDYLMATANLLDGHGVAYIPNSYQAFGNNGTHTVTSMNHSIDYATNTAQPANVLAAMAAVLDHVPVVADYQLPARLGVGFSVPTKVILGSGATATVNVANTANVSYAIGADLLNYTLTGSGSASGGASGSDAALGNGNTHSITLDTATTGTRSAGFSVASTSESVAGNNFSQSFSYDVLVHAVPSFSASTDQTSQTIDFGYVPVGSATRNSSFAIFNRSAAFRAALDVDSINSAGDTARLTTNAATFTDLAAGSSVGYILSLDASVLGNFSATRTFATSDEDIPGATADANLLLTSTARVFAQANFPVSGFLDLPADEPLSTGPFSIAPGVTLTRTGAGSMNITGPQSNGANAKIILDGGVTAFSSDAAGLNVTVNTSATAAFDANQTLTSLTLNGGAANIGSSSSPRVLHTDTFAAAAPSTFDIHVGQLIIDSGIAGSWNGADYTGITGMIRSGLIFSSDATAIGNIGVIASGGGVVVGYSFAGDANLDGRINADDYFQIDSNYHRYSNSDKTQNVGLDYHNGDFNYDGIIDGDDFALIDASLSAQGLAVSPSERFAGASAVPEPATVGLLALAAVALSPRRRLSCL